MLTSILEVVLLLTRKIQHQHGGDWERSRPQALPSPRTEKCPQLFNDCDLWAEHAGMELKCYWFLKNYFWPDYSLIFCDMTVQSNVPWFCTRSICGWNSFSWLFQPLGLNWGYNSWSRKKQRRGRGTEISSRVWTPLTQFWRRRDVTGGRHVQNLWDKNTISTFQSTFGRL